MKKRLKTRIYKRPSKNGKEPGRLILVLFILGIGLQIIAVIMQASVKKLDTKA